MPFRTRVVEVLQRIGEGAAERWSVGSGLRVGGGYVLTASHVIAEGPVIVRVLGRNEDDPKAELAASLFLQGPPDTVDLALLRLTGTEPDDLPRASFARVNRDLPFPDSVRRCQAVGFPLYGTRALSAQDRERISVHIEGDIPLGDDIGHGSLTLQVTRHPPNMTANGQRSESPYVGMSGAAVTVGSSIVGVIGRHLTQEGNALEVTPLTYLRRLAPAERRRWEEALGISLVALPEVREPPVDSSPVLPMLAPRVEGPAPTFVVLDGLTAIGAAQRDFIADLDLTLRTNLLRPEYVLVPGRVAGRAVDHEYATARAVLNAVRTRLGIPAHHVVLVPGPGDVNVEALREHLRRLAESGRRAGPPFWPKWEPYLTGLGDFGGRLTEQAPWSQFEDSGRRLLIVGINSTVFDVGDERARRGRLGEAQMVWLTDLLATRKGDGWTCVGVLYDAPATDDGDPTLADSAQFLSGPARYLDLIVHGRGRSFRHRVVALGRTRILAPSDNYSAAYRVVRLGPAGRVWGRVRNPVTGVWALDPDIGTDPRKGWRRLV